MRSRATGHRSELVERRWWPVALVLAVVSYAPLFLHGPGQRIGDRSLPVLADPGTLLTRSLSIWDAQRGLGGIAESHLSGLWPAGPYLWVTEAVGMPDWISQRLWTGTILFLAGTGVAYLCHSWRWRVSASTAAAFAYTCTPFVALLAGRSSLVLPLAGLPWLLGLTVEAMRRRGWRHPATIALVLAAIAPAGILAVLAVALAPGLWVAHAVFVTGEVPRPRAITTTMKIGALAAPMNLWWIVALSVRWTNGLDVAEASDGIARLSETASAPEVLRGLGHWLLYERAGATYEGYTQDLWLLALTFAIPAVALLALGTSRWRHRSFAIWLVVVGLFLAAGTQPMDGAAPAGRLLAVLVDALPAGIPGQLSLAVPLLALGAALGIGSLVGAAAEEAPRRGLLGLVLVAVATYAAVPPLWSEAFTGAEDPVDESADALVQHLERGGEGTRVLELTTDAAVADDNLPLIEQRLDRRYTARTREAVGSAPAVDLLAALDSRVRDGTLGADALPPVARLLGVGDIVVRGSTEELAGGDALGIVEEFGDAISSIAVVDPAPVLRTTGPEEVVLLSGDGMGIVDAADAGVLEGDELIRYSAAMTEDPAFLVDALRDDRRLVVTDTNRQRARRWTALRDVDGFTETVDGGLLGDDPSDSRLSLPGDRPEARSVVEQRGLSVRATSYGSDRTYRTDRRPAAAVDGDPDTAWIVESPGGNEGERLEIRAATPVNTDQITLLQASGDDTTAIIEAVDLRFDDGDRQRVHLDASSLQAPGQRIEFGDRRFSALSITIAGERPSSGDGIAVRSGLAQVDVAGRTVDEVVRMPTDLLDAAGFRSSRYPLALVMTRVRAGVDQPGRTDEERRIARTVTLPTPRTFEILGTAHRAPHATPGPPDGACRDDLVAVDGRAVAVRLTRAGGGGAIEIEGCEPVSLPGGERLITTTTPDASGISVDQLLLSSAPAAGISSGPGAPTGGGPEITAERTNDSELTVRTDGAAAGAPFWLVLGESYDEGWSIIETEAEVDGPHLVNGHANGFLVIPASADPLLTVRYLPQNRVDVGLLVSAVALLCALLLFFVPAPPVVPAPIPLQEPLRRLRAFTYEGALPGQRTAIRVGVLGAILGLAFAGPVAAVALGAIAGLSTRRETWRPLLTLLPAALVAVIGSHVVFLQATEQIPPGPWWPGLTDTTWVLAISAVILLVLDTVIDHVWRRNSHLR